MGELLKPAGQIEPGDTLHFDAGIIDKSLTGYKASLAVGRVKRSVEGFVDIYAPDSDERVAWPEDEFIRIYRPETG